MVDIYIKIFSDPDYTQLMGTSVPVVLTDAGITGLDNMTVRVISLNSHTQVFDGTVKDVQLWSNKTTPATWTWENSATRGVFGGGSTAGYFNTIDYITIATTGNATDFGDLTVARNYSGGLADATRGVFGSGLTSSGQVNVMDYITISTPSNATDFGNLTFVTYLVAGLADATRGVFGGGNK